MKRLIPTVAAATLAIAASFAFAQGGPGYGPGAGPGGGYGPGYGMRGQGMGPGGGYGPGAGMSEQFCANAADKAQCQARAKERAQYGQQRLEQRQKMHEACNAKRGADLTSCLQGQHQALRNQRLDERQKAHEACSGKRGEELGRCLGEQRQTFGRRAPQSRG